MGTRTEFEQLCHDHSADLVNFAILVAGNRPAGQDLAQDALAELWKRWERSTIDDPVAYLHTIVIRRQHRNGQRFWKREHATETPPAPPAPAGDGAVLDRLWLTRALATLPSRQREAVVLCHVHDYSTADAAALMQCTPAAVRSLCTRGLAALRTNLTKEATDV